jgi:catechol 2,3-dioxygenase-like lactoylglutathione lyase family enzyme
MKTIVLCVILLSMTSILAQQPAGKRPKITGIHHVAFYTTSPDAILEKYRTVLGLASTLPLEPGQTQRFMVGSQWVGYSPAPDPKVTNRMDHVALRTDDCEAMRAYLAANGVKVPDSVTKWKEGGFSFMVKDPEGNSVEFVQPSLGIPVKIVKSGGASASAPDPVSRRIIHAGFIARDRAVEDHFYKDILGFRPYWFGGMHPPRADWVAIQVPDGTDWVEYMLNQPANPDAHISGVMNHVSLGVKDMNATEIKLASHGWTASANEHSQMGRDGKLQLNMYDPDLTRIELMEFVPVDKPCCSEFTGPHPSDND